MKQTIATVYDSVLKMMY